MGTDGPSGWIRQGCALRKLVYECSGQPALRKAALWHDTRRTELPEHDQQLAGKRDDHHPTDASNVRLYSLFEPAGQFR